MVSAYQVCRTATGFSSDLVSVTNIPCYPVGDTLSYFQAAVPALGGAPLAGQAEPK